MEYCKFPPPCCPTWTSQGIPWFSESSRTAQGQCVTHTPRGARPKPRHGAERDTREGTHGGATLRSGGHVAPPCRSPRSRCGPDAFPRHPPPPPAEAAPPRRRPTAPSGRPPGLGAPAPVWTGVGRTCSSSTGSRIGTSRRSCWVPARSSWTPTSAAGHHSPPVPPGSGGIPHSRRTATCHGTTGPRRSGASSRVQDIDLPAPAVPWTRSGIRRPANAHNAHSAP
mmetsp:Transcript_97426/g.231815  ORF Transcript_97426/g.231815 Transcript_97426/m.231815 type:complete len:225 (-) Transcript_97426:838-1512(-)